MSSIAETAAPVATRRVVLLLIQRRATAPCRNQQGERVLDCTTGPCSCDPFPASGGHCACFALRPPQPAPPCPPLSLTEIYNNRGFTGAMTTVSQKDWL